MNLKNRSIVFATFFGSCIAVGILLVCLTTNSWVTAYPKHKLSKDSYGELHYGLFQAHGTLNVGYGTRPRNYSIYHDIISNEPEVMNFWLWLITTLATGIALLSSALGAISAVLKAASASHKPKTMVLLFISNASSIAAQVTAFVTWAVQFYLYLKQNILVVKDRQDNWYSEGLASFGYSFYLLIISSLIVILNITLLMIAHKNDKRAKQRLEPPCDEKNQSAIMLY